MFTHAQVTIFIELYHEIRVLHVHSCAKSLFSLNFTMKLEFYTFTHAQVTIFIELYHEIRVLHVHSCASHYFQCPISDLFIYSRIVMFTRFSCGLDLYL